MLGKSVAILHKIHWFSQNTCAQHIHMCCVSHMCGLLSLIMQGFSGLLTNLQKHDLMLCMNETRCFSYKQSPTILTHTHTHTHTFTCMCVCTFLVAGKHLKTIESESTDIFESLDIREASRKSRSIYKVRSSWELCLRDILANNQSYYVLRYLLM